jgi:undecaprenyl diphosphate synthase
MIKETIAESDQRMKSTIQALEEDLSTIRTGRASPSLVEHMPVDYYGAPTPLMQLASISVPEARVLMIKFGIKYLTIYAFSTENWGRPEDEVSGLMNIIREVIEKELMELHKEGVQLRHIGHLDGLDPVLQKKVMNAVELTRNNDRLILNIAFNYGGRDEILCAVKQIVEEKIPADKITPELFGTYMFTKNCPDPDLIIRTSGELRTSNFLIWQAAYSEWYFSPTYWPDFDEEELRKAVISYSERDRRFGKVSSKEN